MSAPGKPKHAGGRPKRGKIENLDPIHSTEVARERGAKGGRASGISKREKKLMSQIYGEFLAEKFDIVTEEGEAKTLEGGELVSKVVKTVLLAGGSAAVSLMKEIREATEGSKIQLDTGPLEIKVTHNTDGI